MHIDPTDAGTLLFVIVPKTNRFPDFNKALAIRKEKSESESPEVLPMVFQTREEAIDCLNVTLEPYRSGYEVREIIAFGTTEKAPLSENEKDYSSPIFDTIYGALANAGLVADSQNEVAKWLNDNGFCNLTVCPECHVDDFVHIETCKIGRTLDSICKTFKSQIQGMTKDMAKRMRTESL
jgi:hypothetical protein